MKAYRRSLAVACLIAIAVSAAPAAANGLNEIEGLPLVKNGHLNIDSHASVAHHRGFDPTDYSNITNFQAAAFAPGGVTAGITKCIADDLTPAGLAPDEEVFSITFSVYNGNGAAVSVRCRVRFWTEEGSDRPENAIAGFSFAAVSFDPGVTLVKGDFIGSGMTMPSSAFWSGEQFDNMGAPATTSAMLDNFGQGLFDPVEVGSSTDKHWVSTNAANVFTNVPAGTTTSAPFTGTSGAVANYAWEWQADTIDPTAKSTWGRIKSLYR